MWIGEQREHGRFGPIGNHSNRVDEMPSGRSQSWELVGVGELIPTQVMRGVGKPLLEFNEFFLVGLDLFQEFGLALHPFAEAPQVRFRLRMKGQSGEVTLASVELSLQGVTLFIEFPPSGVDDPLGVGKRL